MMLQSATPITSSPLPLHTLIVRFHWSQFLWWFKPIRISVNSPADVWKHLFMWHCCGVCDKDELSWQKQRVLWWNFDFG